MADEVGLGKIIKAGPVLSQQWAERKRRILLLLSVTPRSHWQAEMEEKFFGDIKGQFMTQHGLETLFVVQLDLVG